MVIRKAAVTPLLTGPITVTQVKLLFNSAANNW